MSRDIFQQRVKQELEKSSERYHILGAWIAIIFDPIFAITDYINIPNGWSQLLIIRLTVAAITFVVLKFRDKLKIHSNRVIVFVPFILISLQNAYTFSLISSDNIMGHCLNYIALLIGAGMFILWNWRYSAFTLVVSAIATEFFVAMNPNIPAEEFLLQGGLLLITVSIFMLLMIQARYSLTIKEIKARLEIEKLNEELTEQKELVEEKNRHVMSSIRYAQRIQNAIMGNENVLNEYFQNSFALFKPKDILSGDFYWFYENKTEDIKIIIAADCTGHGVPGALTTVLGSSILNDIVVQKRILMPDQILKELDRGVIQSFSSEENQPDVQDGMDISVLLFKNNKVYFSAAKNPLYYVEDGEMKKIRGSKFAIGSDQYSNEKIFDLHELDLPKGTKLYIFSDGFQDQIGEATDRKYMTKTYREFLLKTSTLSMMEQKSQLEKEFMDWKGNAAQTDDVLVVGIEI